MKLPVIWSNEAKRTFEETVDFILLKWTTKEAERFLERTEKAISLIQKYPNMYPYSKKENVHRAVISSQTSLYYEIINDTIFLLFFEDNRTNPLY